MAATDLLKRVPDVGRNALLFFRRPREFVATSAFRRPLTAKEQFVWSIAFTALIVGLYSLAAGSPMARLWEAAGLPQAVSADASVHSRPAERDAPVTYAGISWGFRIGAGVRFPELLPVSEPQRAQFQVGAVEVDLNNVVPLDVFEKGSEKFLLALYALVSALCIYPVARVFRGRASFGDTLRLTFVFYGFSYLLLQIVAVAAVTAFVDVIRLRGLSLVLAWFLGVVLPSFGVVLRGFFSGFSELYAITKKQMALVVIGTAISSIIVSPIVFLPLLFLLLRFEPLWKLLL